MELDSIKLLSPIADALAEDITSGKKNSAELFHSITFIYNNYLTRLADDLDEWRKQLSVLAVKIEQAEMYKDAHSPLLHIIPYINQYRSHFEKAAIYVREAANTMFPNVEQRHVGKENEKLIQEASVAKGIHDYYYRNIEPYLDCDMDQLDY